MFILPLYSLLVVYGFFLLWFITFTAVNFVHLVKTGTFTFLSFTATCLFAGAVFFILWGTVVLLADSAWQEPLFAFDNGVFDRFFSLKGSAAL